MNPPYLSAHSHPPPLVSRTTSTHCQPRAAPRLDCTDHPRWLADTRERRPNAGHAPLRSPTVAVRGRVTIVRQASRHSRWQWHRLERLERRSRQMNRTVRCDNNTIVTVANRNVIHVRRALSHALRSIKSPLPPPPPPPSPSITSMRQMAHLRLLRNQDLPHSS